MGDGCSKISHAYSKIIYRRPNWVLMSWPWWNERKLFINLQKHKNFGGLKPSQPPASAGHVNYFLPDVHKYSYFHQSIRKVTIEENHQWFSNKNYFIKTETQIRLSLDLQPSNWVSAWFNVPLWTYKHGMYLSDGAYGLYSLCETTWKSNHTQM